MLSRNLTEIPVMDEKGIAEFYRKSLSLKNDHELFSWRKVRGVLVQSLSESYKVRLTEGPGRLACCRCNKRSILLLADQFLSNRTGDEMEWQSF